MYGRPVDELQRQITSRHFNELQAYRNRNTLNPDLWWSSARQTSIIAASMSGEWIDPRELVPGQLDPDAVREARARQAERALDRKAKDNGGNR